MEDFEFEIENRRIKIVCLTFGCRNPRSAGQKSTHRSVPDFSAKSKLAAIKSIEGGTRTDAYAGSQPTQGLWKRTQKGWLCPKCIASKKKVIKKK